MLDDFQESTADVGGGITLRLRSGGRGDPVVLLHGHPRTHTTWQRVAPLLVRAGHTVVCLDLRSYGQSSKPAAGSANVRQVSDAPDEHQPPARADAPVVVFDLGGVLAHPEDLLARLAAIADLEPAAFEAAYWAHRPAYDAGCPDAAYWGPVVAEAGGRPSATVTHALTEADCAIWGDLPLVSRALLADLVDAGVRLGLLSNAPTAMARWVRDADWAQPFEHLVVSGQQGCMKPDPVIYQLTTALFAVEPEQITFFDDREDNVAAARAVGWDAHVWAGPAPARAVLAARGVPGSGG